MKSTTLTASFLLTAPQTSEKLVRPESRLKVVFFGTPAFSAEFLSGLIADPYFDVVGVVTQSDEPLGRKKILTAPATKKVALEKGIPVFQPTKLQDPEFHNALQALKADIFVIVAYGRILPRSVLDIPKLGCVNVHPSLLPKWRGPSPIIATIAHGDAKTGVSIMKIDDQMDHGPLLSQEEIILDGVETVESLTKKVVEVGSPLLNETLKAYHVGAAKLIEQKHEEATYCKLLSREDGEIDLTDDPVVLERKIRAYNPWPGTWTMLERGGKMLRVKVLEAKLQDGKLELLKVQPEGKKPMSWSDFERGHAR